MEQHPDSPAVATAHSAASLEADLNPQPQAENALVAESAPAPPATRDARGFNSADYQWVPVLRKPRKDGWTPQRQLDFIRALADMGCVEQAAREVGMSVTSCYRLRNSPGAESFAAAWDTALAHAARKLVDLAFDRAIHGSDEPVFDKQGRRVGRRMRQNDRLLMFLLRPYMPERFRHAYRDGLGKDEPLPPPAEPLGQVLERLEPVAPPEPHKLMPPDELETAIQCADILDGELPHWHRGRGDAEPVADYSLGPEFERALEAAKHGGAEPFGVEGEGEEDPFLA
jgi:hypothetical protein